MLLKAHKIVPQNPKQPQPVYLITFEDYLKPQKVSKSKPLLLSNKKPELRLRLLEHPVLVAGRKSKWRLLKEKIQKLWKKWKTMKNSQKTKITYLKKKPKPDITLKAAAKWRNTVLKNPTHERRTMQLPAFLSFLKARNDDGLCKKKSGFEIYCEMASIHGFINFVGSTTAQRAFWCFVLFVAIGISVGILIMSHLMNESTPTILYTESTQHPSWSIPFPGVTICNLNRLSKNKAMKMAESIKKPANLTVSQLMKLFTLAFYATENIQGAEDDYRKLSEVLENNQLNLEQLVDSLTPDCQTQIQRCKWKGHYMKCSKLFKSIQTAYGKCCSFNENSLKKSSHNRNDVSSNEKLEYSTSCGPETGFTLLFDPELQDYQLSGRKTPGLKVFIHDTYDYTHSATKHYILPPRTVNRLALNPRQTYASDYIRYLNVPERRCYLHGERKLYYFPSYSHGNCLSECKSALLYEKCHCTLANWPRKGNWTVCGLKDRECFMKTKDLFNSNVKSVSGDYRHKHSAQKFVCDCYPLCDFNEYNFYIDSRRLDRRFSLNDKRFFKDINITDHILVHIFYEDLYAERLRLDVYENWLSFIGTFGGITGLQMGYSAVSGFELIFFVFIRPACNWLTKKQIMFRIKRRQKKAAKEAKKKKEEEEKKRKEREEKEKQERIEAYLKMRAYCPGY